MKAGKDLFKKLFRWFGAKLETYYLSRYYSSLEELPIWNWWKIHETKDFKYLLKEKKKVTSHAGVIFDKLHSEFIRIFGVSDSYKTFLEKLVEIELSEIEMVTTGDRSIETFIDIMKIELEELAPKGDSSYMDNAIAVEKFMGFKMNPKEMSVFEYYSYINTLEKSVGNGK